MNKFIVTTFALLTTMVGADAMSYDQAREQAAFLTDKMAYELNMTEEQYDAAYEINLDYLMSVDNVNDVYADNWQERNYNMEDILLDWQWDAFCRASYFYRPLYYGNGAWHFGVYARYPQRDQFFYERPAAYFAYAPQSNRQVHNNFNMRRDSMRRGNMTGGPRQTMNNGMGGMRRSSTRSTVGNGGGFHPQMNTHSTNSFGTVHGSGTFGGGHGSGSFGGGHR